MPISFIFTAATKLGQGYIFTGVCDSVHRGGHAWLPGRACVVAGGCAWLPGGMHGCWEHVWLLGVCMVAGGHAWLLGGVHGCQGMHGCRGACVAVGVRGCGVCAWWQGGACVGYDEIRSMSGRYASYWNAFLFNILKKVNLVSHCVVVPVFRN